MNNSTETHEGGEFSSFRAKLWKDSNWPEELELVSRRN
jgi:hypothetical protein